MTAVIKKHHLVFNGKKYFRAGSEDVGLGSYGEKRTPAGGGNYLLVEGNLLPKSMRFRAKQATVVDIDFKRSRRTSFVAKGSAPIVGGWLEGNMGATYDSLASGKLKLVKFRILPTDLEDAVNTTRNVLARMKHDGMRARIANEIFIVMEATLAKKVTSGVNAKVSGSAGMMKLTVESRTSASNETSLTISKGTTFAYMLLKPEWDRRIKSRRTRIVDWEDDQWGVS